MTPKRPTHARPHARPSATAQRRANHRGAQAAPKAAAGSTGPSLRRETHAVRKDRGKTAGAGGIAGAGGVGAGRPGGAGSPTLRGEAATGVRVPTPGGGEILLTRRHFLYGALGVGALAAVGGGVVAASGALQQDDSDELHVLEVPEDAVTTSDELTEVDLSSAVSLVSSFELPYGTLVWANDDNVAACLLPTEQAKPLARWACSFWGRVRMRLPFAGRGARRGVRDLRRTRLLHRAGVDGGRHPGRRVARLFRQLRRGDRRRTPAHGGRHVGMGDAHHCRHGGFAFWQVLPRADGPRRSEASLLKRAAFGTGESSVVYESHGRMSTPPYALADSVVITPRTDTSSIHHQLTRIDARTGDVMDAMVLPTSMKPLEAGYGNTGFMFTFDAIYNYGDGIANLGTYTPAAQVAAAPADGLGNAAYSAARWFRHTRTPTAAPAWCGRYSW